MPRGHPDYNAGDITFFSVNDPNADLLATQSGFYRLDNRGRMVFFDDFRQGIRRWQVSQSDTDREPYHYYPHNFSVGYHGCVALAPTVDNDISLLETTLVLPVSRYLGLECALYLSSNYSEVELILQHLYSGTSGKEGKIDILPDTNQVRLISTPTNPVIFTPSSASIFVSRWISLKFVCDFENGTYKRLMLGNTEYDISQYALRSGDVGLVGQSKIRFRATGYTSTYKEPWYLGYVIISSDEA